MNRTEFLIGGRWTRPHSSDLFVSISSATEQEIGRSPQGTAADLNDAVNAAQAALPGWAGCGGAQRADMMLDVATALGKRADELGTLIAHEVGSPLTMATRANVAGPVAYLRYFAQLAAQAEEFEARGRGGTLVARRAVGVVAMIVPWNYPIGLIHFKLAPALAAGCTAVLKPSPETALSSYLFADAVHEAGLPAGVVNVVPAGRDAGEHLVCHPGVDKVSFTGSTAAGRRIGELCGRALKPVTLELGGKSAAVLLDDAPLDRFLDAVESICLANNGQTCTNHTRVVVPRSRYSEVLEALAATVSGYHVGDPTDPATQIGPLVSAVAKDRVHAEIRATEAGGARRVTDPPAHRGSDRGFFVTPTVFGDVTPEMDIARREIFGPVLAVLAYDGGDDAAVALANDSDYGLAGTVWSADDDRAFEVASRIDTGTVGINSYLMDPSAPFGGHKASGLGYELGPEGLQSFQKLTTIYGVNRQGR